MYRDIFICECANRVRYLMNNLLQMRYNSTKAL
jgi:hypothetical protein